MRTSIEVFDDSVQAKARVEELRTFGAKDPRLIIVERLTAVDRRPNMPVPNDWVREKTGADLHVVQYER